MATKTETRDATLAFAQAADREEANTRALRRDEIIDALWDTAKLDVLQLFYDGKLTRAQVQSIREIFTTGFKKITVGEGDEESLLKVCVNNFAVNMIGKTVSVVIRFNRTDWKGTAASMLCGSYGHFFVGIRGGIEAKGYSSRVKKTDVQRFPLIYGWSH